MSLNLRPLLETTNLLSIQWLDRVDYQQSLALQERLVTERHAGSIPDQLLLLEHEPVYTMGRTPDQSGLRGPSAPSHPLIQTNRGGQATFHGPGQLVGYPILDLRRHGQDLHRSSAPVELLIRVCGD